MFSLLKSICKKNMSTATGAKVTQPKWWKPEMDLSKKSVLKVYNTLTRSKEEFIPRSGTKEVSWYSCGPTVYDASHMGHARNYVSIDINRRILQDYFGYNINFVQNVTDIDDKIILRARQNHLFEEYVKSIDGDISNDVISKIESSLFQYIEKNLKQSSIKSINDFENWYKQVDVESMKNEDPKFPMHITAVQNAIKALNDPSSQDFFNLVKDVLVPVLDKELGSSINHPEIFRKLPAYWEHQYDNDMAKLNVLPPNVTTRVSEYVPEIIEFVEKIISNGYAYAADDGSVYFDTQNFDTSKDHSYAKCQPWNKGHLDLINDAEGSLSNFSNTNGKKSPSDFALWKASKPGEPEWESPWGKGRPGWHIECSVMASDILGQNIDIHSGGIDLAFPHHDNELAQSEAHFDNNQWINYFLHTGHLHIEGQKMSKSLKNFITIDEALKMYSARQLRLAFASVQWNNQLDFKESLINEVRSTETSFNNFFANVRALNNDYINIISQPNGFVSKKLGSLERQLLEDFKIAQEKVDIAFCDNLATPQALKALSDLVTLTNTYISSVGNDIRIEPIISICKFITKIFGIIGFPVRSDGLGWENADSSNAANGSSVEETVMPYVQCLSKFRDIVRSLSIEKANYVEFLKLTDQIRDDDLLKLNIALDDRNGQSALIKFLTDNEKNEIIKNNEEKLAREQEKLKKKLEQQKLKEAKENERMEKAKVSPQEMFKTSEYTEWDEQGLPTKDKDGNEVTKSMTKKLKKQWEQQKKLHEEYLSKL
ncbi:hypothetical protein Kpol_2000p30 [Vanderwaltozyma polyspora DSM 70294]|uniref:cysteine--tRNA ligase n=1 Tax=Vanderwaltozyma polyspora (strain ATCC 22028 / DSM 70294 / BCRC 21397 / CBS 2163 / NBRC 10782 / NRRL Y-8283 / UCD 57-17) TaxID=436907 RepID=A7TF40_VANPO|nr:uncharacterized protein Kpol_2000p30 [Vanderwaltozyma polyspora DSM 70294]EDO19065.1 hypothetical protein Kpol_2000p30 [Vanderwaltozyma polyspora DSM 70294]